MTVPSPESGSQAEDHEFVQSRPEAESPPANQADAQEPEDTNRFARDELLQLDEEDAAALAHLEKSARRREVLRRETADKPPSLGQDAAAQEDDQEQDTAVREDDEEFFDASVQEEEDDEKS